MRRGAARGHASCLSFFRHFFFGFPLLDFLSSLMLMVCCTARFHSPTLRAEAFSWQIRGYGGGLMLLLPFSCAHHDAQRHAHYVQMRDTAFRVFAAGACACQSCLLRQAPPRGTHLISAVAATIIL